MASHPTTTADALQGQVRTLVAQALAEIEQADRLAELESLRVKYLGKKAALSGLQKQIPQVHPPEARKEFGRVLNDAKRAIETALAERRPGIEAAETRRRLERERIDVTLPGLAAPAGGLHPIVQTVADMKRILLGLGFRYDEYPELETEYYNFEALNTPPWHPARDEQSSFYTTHGRVPRTHTSAFQVHAMQQFGPPPIRAMTAGRCYRADTEDATHAPIFHQLDGIAIERGISFADLKSILDTLARGLFGETAQLRFRPSYFPFTTPSAEVDVSCISCGGRGCAACSGTGWMEILGCGMMRPEVLRAGGIDPAVCRGLAFGIGVDRITMRRHGIRDIRDLYANEIAFLEQYPEHGSAIHPPHTPRGEPDTAS